MNENSTIEKYQQRVGDDNPKGKSELILSPQLAERVARLSVEQYDVFSKLTDYGFLNDPYWIDYLVQISERSRIPLEYLVDVWKYAQIFQENFGAHLQELALLNKASQHEYVADFLAACEQKINSPYQLAGLVTVRTNQRQELALILVALHSRVRGSLVKLMQLWVAVGRDSQTFLEVLSRFKEPQDVEKVESIEILQWLDKVAIDLKRAPEDSVSTSGVVEQLFRFRASQGQGLLLDTGEQSLVQQDSQLFLAMARFEVEDAIILLGKQGFKKLWLLAAQQSVTESNWGEDSLIELVSRKKQTLAQIEWFRSAIGRIEQLSPQVQAFVQQQITSLKDPNDFLRLYQQAREMQIILDTERRDKKAEVYAPLASLGKYKTKEAIDFSQPEVWERLNTAVSAGLAQVEDIEKKLATETIQYQLYRISVTQLALLFHPDPENAPTPEEYQLWFLKNFGVNTPEITIARRTDEQAAQLGSVRVAAGWTGSSEHMSHLYRYGEDEHTFGEFLLKKHQVVITYPSPQFAGATTVDELRDLRGPFAGLVLENFAQRIGVDRDEVSDSDLLKRMFNSFAASELYHYMDEMVGEAEYCIGHSRSGDAVIMESSADILKKVLALMPASSLSGNSIELLLKGWQRWTTNGTRSVEDREVLEISMTGNFKFLEYLIRAGSLRHINRLDLPRRFGRLVTKLFTKDASLGAADETIAQDHQKTIEQAWGLATALAIGLLANGSREGYTVASNRMLENLPFLVLAEKDRLSVYDDVKEFVQANFEQLVDDWQQMGWLAGEPQEILKELWQTTVLNLEDVGHYAFIGEYMEQILERWWEYLAVVEPDEVDLAFARFFAKPSKSIVIEIVADADDRLFERTLQERYRDTYRTCMKDLKEVGLPLRPLEFIRLRKALALQGEHDIEILMGQKRKFLNKSA